MYFLNLSNGLWLRKYLDVNCFYFTRFQSNHLQGVKEFDMWDYNLVYSLLMGKTFIFDGTVGTKYLADGLKQFLIGYIVFLFYFRLKVGFSKKEFLEDRKKFKDFLTEHFVFFSSISQQYKGKLIASVIDYVYNFFDVKSDIKIKNKDIFLKHMENFRKYFGGDKRSKWWESGKFNLNYKIYFLSENFDIFFEKFIYGRKKLPERFLLIGNIKKFYLDDKTLDVI